MRSGSWVLVRNHVVVDASIRGEPPRGPFFSSDGGHVSYWRCDGPHWSAVVDGTTVGIMKRPLSWARSLAVGLTGRVAYAGHSDNGVFVVAAGKSKVRSMQWPLVFSGDGTRLAYIARRGNEGFLLLDGTTVGRFDSFLPEEGLYADYLEDYPSFSPDSAASLACRVARAASST